MRVSARVGGVNASLIKKKSVENAPGLRGMDLGEGGALGISSADTSIILNGAGTVSLGGGGETEEDEEEDEEERRRRTRRRTWMSRR